MCQKEYQQKINSKTKAKYKKNTNTKPKNKKHNKTKQTTNKTKTKKLNNIPLSKMRLESGTLRIKNITNEKSTPKPKQNTSRKTKNPGC